MKIKQVILQTSKRKNLSESLSGSTAETLNIGDPVVITGNVQHQGHTGDIVGFDRNKSFVVVDLYNYGRRSFHTSDVSFNDYAGSDSEEQVLKQRLKFESQQGVSEGLVGDVVVHNYTKMPIDLKPGQVQIHGWGPDEQPIYRVKGHDGKEVITSNKKKMMMIAKGPGVAKGSGDKPGVTENSFGDEFLDFAKKFGQKRGIDVGVRDFKPRLSTPEPAAAAEQPVDRAALETRLKELQARFDPAYEYSDDHAFWTEQNEIAKEIRSIKRALSQQGVVEGSEVQKTFKVVYHSPKTDRTVTKLIKASNESEIWDKLRRKDIQIISVSGQGVTESLSTNWKSWDPDNYESESPEFYSSLSDAILSLVSEKFEGKAWFDGGGYAYLIDVSNPKKLVSSDGAAINVPNVARGLEKYTSNFKENIVDVYPSGWPDFFRSARKNPGPESDQEWYELGKMGIDVRENSRKLSKRGLEMANKRDIDEGLKDPKDNPCWKGYKPVGTKKKNGKTVPNCVPKEGVAEGLPGSSQIYDQIESLSDKLKHTSDPDKRRFYVKQIKKLEHKLHSTDDPFDIDDPAPIGKKGVAEGSERKDMTGQTCEKCKKDKYKERSQHDDMEGKVTCSCGHRVNRWKNYKEQGVAEGFKNTYNVGDRVDSPLGTGTIVAVSKNINVDGRVKVKLDDPSRAGEDGKYKDSFVLDTIQLKHISEQGVAEGFSDVVKGIKRSLKGKEHPDVVASKHAGRAIGHYNQGNIAAGDKETERYVKTRDMHLKAKGKAEGLEDPSYKKGWELCNKDPSADPQFLFRKFGSGLDRNQFMKGFNDNAKSRGMKLRGDVGSNELTHGDIKYKEFKRDRGMMEDSGPQVGDEVYYGNRLVGWFKGYSKLGKIITEPNVDEMGDEYLSKDVYWGPQDKITIKSKKGIVEGQFNKADKNLFNPRLPPNTAAPKTSTVIKDPGAEPVLVFASIKDSNYRNQFKSYRFSSQAAAESWANKNNAVIHSIKPIGGTTRK